MLYTYTAKDSRGDAYAGEYEADSKFELYAKVKSEGGKILSVRSKSKSLSALQKMLGHVSTEDKIFLAKNLSSMLTAGLSVTRALGVMEKQAKKLALKDLLQDIEEDVAKGQTLSAALSKRSKVFPDIFIAMVRAGEESGNLDQSLKAVGLQMEKSHSLLKRVRGALIYPAVVLSLMVVISLLLLTYMVPTLTATFEGLGVALPLSTRIIIASSDFLVRHTFAVVLTLLAAATSAYLFLKSAPGKRLSDKLAIRLPIVGPMTKEIQSARMARTFSSLISAGVPIVDALEVTENVLGNHLYKKAISEARKAVQEGETVSHILSRHEHLYPAFVGEMAAVGEETGKIAEMLTNVAVYYEESIDEKTKNLSTVIEPALMVVIGAGVGIFAISMLAPTYSLVGNI